MLAKYLTYSSCRGIICSGYICVLVQKIVTKYCWCLQQSSILDKNEQKPRNTLVLKL